MFASISSELTGYKLFHGGAHPDEMAFFSSDIGKAVFIVYRIAS